MTCQDGLTKQSATTLDTRRRVLGSPRLIAIIDAVLTLQDHNTALEQDAATATRRFTSSIATVPEPGKPSAKDALGQAPTRGRRRAESPRILNTLFPRRS